MSAHHLVAIAILGLVIHLPSQQSIDRDGLVAQLREIANRQPQTEADAAKRAADVGAWLDATRDRDLGEIAVLRAIASTFVSDADTRRRASADLIEWFKTHDALPVAGFEECAGQAVMFNIVHRANAGNWQECKDLLPILLRVSSNHTSVFWLLGRRGRDAGTAEGQQFLQQVVIPSLLSDHAIDDADRVHLLRLLYKVEYTGPKPFTDVVGPGLDGQEVRTADYRGRVILVDYWATWCGPCLAAMPGVVAAHRRFRDQGFAVVGISIDDADKRERVAAKVRELEMEFPVIYEGKGWKSDSAIANKVLAVPATFLIDRKGRVRWTGLEGDALQQRVAELLAEK